MNKGGASDAIDNDTLAKVVLATVAGVSAVAGVKKLYNKYKEYKALQKYASRENIHPGKMSDELRSHIPDIEDIIVHGAREYTDTKR